MVVDSRAARVLGPDRRDLLDDDEMAWLDGQMRGDVKHLFIGTSLPFLLPPGLHYLEAWSEAVGNGAWGKRSAALGEKLRRPSTSSTGAPSRTRSRRSPGWPSRSPTASAARPRRR